MEILLLRIDHFRDKAQYVKTLREWLQELNIEHGRLITISSVHLLFVAAETDKVTALLERFKTQPIDTNSKGELCIDRFIDTVGRKAVKSTSCNGFLEMNIINQSLLEKALVYEWSCEKKWIEEAMSTPRSKAFIKWRDEAKAARKGRRKRAAQDRDAEKKAKRMKKQEEEEKAKKEAQVKEEAAIKEEPSDTD